MDKYSISVQWSNADNGYIATIPELPGLSAFGKTIEKALEELIVAKEAYIEVFEEDGCRLPEPDVLNNYSGQTRLRLPKTLHAELSRAAKNEGVSFNTYLIHLLSERNVAHLCLKKIEKTQELCSYIHDSQISKPFGSYYGNELTAKPSTRAQQNFPKTLYMMKH